MLSPSPWPIFFSLCSMQFVISTIFFMKKKLFFIMQLGLFILLFMFFYWVKDVNREGEMSEHMFEIKDGFKLGMGLFIFSEVMFFLAWFWGFFHSSMCPGEDLGEVWPPFMLESMDPMSLPLLNTLILLSSGAFVTISHNDIMNDKKCDDSLFMTILLGLLFTYYQLSEYSESSFSIMEGIYGSTFFITTGFHGFHVIVGTLFLFYSWILMKKNSNNKLDHLSYVSAIWYWHFVDVVWLYLFIFMYFWST